MYLKKVILKNFQSHEYTEIELVKGINAIIGPSDSGKTAIIRGIRWALYNEPSGDSFRRHQTKETEVKLEFSDGFSLLRGRKSTTNYYKISEEDGEEAYYEAFGNTLPPEIEEHLGIRQVSLAKNLKEELNISRQLDPPFLLGESPRVKAEAIGRLSGAYIADLALEKLSKELRDQQREIRNEEREIQEAEDSLKNYEHLIEEEKILKTIDKLFVKIEEREILLGKVSEFSKKLEKVHLQRKKEEQVLEKTKNLEKIENIYEDLSRKLEKMNQFQLLERRWTKNREGQEISLKELERTKHLALLEEKRDLLLGKVERLNLLEKFAQELNTNRKKQKENLQKIHAFPIEETDLLVQHAKESFEELKILKSLEVQLMDFSKKAREAKKTLQRTKDLPIIEKNIKRVEELGKDLEFIKSLENKLSLLSKKQQKLARIYLLAGEKIEEVSEEYRKILQHLKICPTCHSSLTEEQLDQMLKDLRI